MWSIGAVLLQSGLIPHIVDLLDWSAPGAGTAGGAGAWSATASPRAHSSSSGTGGGERQQQQDAAVLRALAVDVLRAMRSDGLYVTQVRACLQGPAASYHDGAAASCSACSASTALAPSSGLLRALRSPMSCCFVGTAIHRHTTHLHATCRRPLLRAPQCFYPPPPCPVCAHHPTPCCFDDVPRQVAELLDDSPVWAAYRDQRHDLFLPSGAAAEGSVVGLLQAPDEVRYALPAPEQR